MTQPKPFCALLLLFVCSMVSDATAQQADSVYDKAHYHYFALTLLSGTGFLLSGNDDDAINLSFPYSVINSSGSKSDSVFISKPIKPYRFPKVFLFPITAEIGGLRHFVNFGFSFPLVGNSTGGYNLFAGYGYTFYVNGFGDRSRRPEQKAFLIKPSLALSYTQDNGFNDPARMGTIDNSDKTILLFGQTASPSYSITTSYGRSGTSTTTYSAKTLDISYAQYELAVMPKITITSNPYLNGIRWALTIGYNIPLNERGRIQLLQDDGDGNQKAISSPIPLSDGRLLATYNNQPITAAPYRFSNYFLSLEISAVHFKYRKFKPGRPNRGLFGRRRAPRAVKD
jgi:hypothetical protein